MSASDGVGVNFGYCKCTFVSGRTLYMYAECLFSLRYHSTPGRYISFDFAKQSTPKTAHDNYTYFAIAVTTVRHQ